jgi:uncharacterized protein (DUF3084 family)
MTPSPFPRTPPESPDTITSAGFADLADILEYKDKTQSIELLSLMVDDLRNEVGVLRTQLEESEQECSKLRSETKEEEEGDRQRIQSLLEALSQVSQSKGKFTQDELEALNAEEAANLTIGTLTRKVEELSINNTALTEEKVGLMQRVQELEGENEAKQVKIDALELQFKGMWIQYTCSLSEKRESSCNICSLKLVGLTPFSFSVCYK